MLWIPNQLEGAYLGQDVTLECHSEAYPKSINYWVKEDGAMLISSESTPFKFRSHTVAGACQVLTALGASWERVDCSWHYH